MKKIETLVIAVGGKGTRLSSYFQDVSFNNTKTLFPIDGKPLLKYLIDAALSNGYKKIFLLASFYEKEIKKFVSQFYNDKNVSVIAGGEEGKSGGVAKVLSLIEHELKSPFVYSDGDILFEPNLLSVLADIKLIDKALFNCVISKYDTAPTHSQFIINNDKLSKINLRYKDSINESSNGYCSLGLMVINNKIFNFIPEYKDLNDLDQVVYKIFNINSDKVNFQIYEGDWFSIHKREDIDIIKNGYYNNLLCSLKKY
jgi:NDP-sugar pyrophosphorylase family protein